MTPSEQRSIVVGHVEPKPLPVIVRREPEVGAVWEACCDAFGLCALGATPGEAAAHLGNMLRERGLVEVLDVNPEAVDALVAKERSRS